MCCRRQLRTLYSKIVCFGHSVLPGHGHELLHSKGICDLVAIVDIAQAIMAPQTMLDFSPKLVIIKHRLVPCEEYQAGNVFDRASFITIFNLCEDLRVPEREVFIDVFKAATVQKASIQRNNARTRMPEVSWRLAVGC